ncbi:MULTISPECIES: cypemycin family RiPP [unclassified Streptomyces]|uniref:cypemycin family RiPP n=1 Tax=unclassified Streptomyces TaxID=2593676 RepID=UPI001BEA0FBD|nr:cypemycin family RiPP [Streptomyces sp. McG3]MBT2900936.1 cypemycin family RiPP [Streptomyces sp. McG3]
MRIDSMATQEKATALPESMATQDFANSALVGAVPGFHSDPETPAMATPAVAQFVIQGSTICLVC